MHEQIAVAIVSGIAGGILVFLSQYLLPTLLVEGLKERRALRKAFRRHSTPLMYSTYQLYRRLRNILEEGNYAALSDDWKPTDYWPMTRIYFVQSTLYLFGCFFASLERYYTDIADLSPGTLDVTQKFNRNVRASQRALYDVSMNVARERDYQVYLLDQKAMGEALLSDKTRTHVVTFLDFKKKLAEDPSFKEQFEPVKSMLVELRPETTDFRFARLTAFTTALRDLYSFLGEQTQGDIFELEKRIPTRPR